MSSIIRASIISIALVVALDASATNTYSGASSRIEPARSQASGGAGVSIGGDPSLMWINPGILATCDGRSLSMGAQRGTAADISSQIQWTQPLKSGTLSAGLGYYTAGSAEYWLPDGTSTMLSPQRDSLFFAGWGANVLGNIGAGFDLKAVNTELAGTAQGGAVGMDLGLHLVFSEIVSGGLAFQNLGSAVKWGKDSMSQPALVRTGIAAVFPVRENIMGDPADFLQLMQDVSYSFSDGIFMSATGAEYQWNNAAFMRVGLRASSRRELTGFSAGAGIRTAIYRLDYAVWLGSPIEMPHILTITFFFK